MDDEALREVFEEHERVRREAALVRITASEMTCCGARRQRIEHECQDGHVLVVERCPMCKRETRWSRAVLR